jgi:hypothetical protein
MKKTLLLLTFACSACVNTPQAPDLAVERSVTGGPNYVVSPATVAWRRQWELERTAPPPDYIAQLRQQQAQEDQERQRQRIEDSLRQGKQQMQDLEDSVNTLRNQINSD